ASELLPDWYANPDPTGKSKLTTLAQELGMLVLPEAFMPESFEAAHVSHLGQAVERAGVAVGASVVPLELTAESGKQGVLYVVWPAKSAAETFAANAPAKTTPAATPSVAPQATPAKPVAAAPTARPTIRPAVSIPNPKQAQDLPKYSKSLLRIKVPVR